MGDFRYPSPHRSGGDQCDAHDPDDNNRCGLRAPHVGKSHMARTADAILSWGMWGDEIHRWPVHAPKVWIESAPWA